MNDAKLQIKLNQLGTLKGTIMNRTFSIIKPDATKRNITGSINKVIEENGLRKGFGR